SEPIYVPVKYDKNSGTDSDDSSDTHAEDAVLSRLSYSASLKAEEDRLKALSKLSVKQVAKLVGALWALLSSILYALYLVSLRRKVDHEDKLDIPMFFGFVGIICSVIIWPGFLILHYSKTEIFIWPTRSQWLYITVNGLIGTVFSEFLWLWYVSYFFAAYNKCLVTSLSQKLKIKGRYDVTIAKTASYI
ncbi:hypothetical protein LOTGIDRAFT_175977, partial [Lottia gigantea]